MIRLGLRFERRDTKLLYRLAAQVRNGEMGMQAANVFEQAARAAASGELLELHCSEPNEAVEMAAAYIRFGVTRPVIEQLLSPQGR